MCNHYIKFLELIVTPQSPVFFPSCYDCCAFSLRISLCFMYSVSCHVWMQHMYSIVFYFSCCCNQTFYINLDLFFALIFQNIMFVTLYSLKVQLSSCFPCSELQWCCITFKVWFSSPAKLDSTHFHTSFDPAFTTVQSLYSLILYLSLCFYWQVYEVVDLIFCCSLIMYCRKKRIMIEMELATGNFSK